MDRVANWVTVLQTPAQSKDQFLPSAWEGVEVLWLAGRKDGGRVGLGESGGLQVSDGQWGHSE